MSTRPGQARVLTRAPTSMRAKLGLRLAPRMISFTKPRTSDLIGDGPIHQRARQIAGRGGFEVYLKRRFELSGDWQRLKAA
jgi:hypothetical protein